VGVGPDDRDGPVKYRTIVADPPWHYDAMPIGGDQAGTFGQTRPLAYQTMTTDEIAALPVSELADRNAVLWLWTTNRWLPNTFAVMRAWGFDYRQTLVWGKNNPMPIGSVAPSAAEFLLVGKRGKPDLGWSFPSSVIVTPRPKGRVHSQKPECFLDYIEQMSPSPRIELFARRARFGWDYWGDQSLGTAELAS
jgi:N6-adenosine-specific RNA methylase IME4